LSRCRALPRPRRAAVPRNLPAPEVRTIPRVTSRHEPPGIASRPMDANRTTAVIQGYLDELAGVRGGAGGEPAGRPLLRAAARGLHELCATLLYRSYPRLARGPINLQSDEMLGAVVERLIKAMRKARPGNVRQFFQIANQHMRWELNEVARRFDEKSHAV